MESKDAKSIEQKWAAESENTLEMSEEDLEQVNGGTDNTISSPTYGVQKDKMASANKNAKAVKRFTLIC